LSFSSIAVVEEKKQALKRIYCIYVCYLYLIPTLRLAGVEF